MATSRTIPASPCCHGNAITLNVSAALRVKIRLNSCTTHKTAVTSRLVLEGRHNPSSINLFCQHGFRKYPTVFQDARIMSVRESSREKSKIQAGRVVLSEQELAELLVLEQTRLWDEKQDKENGNLDSRVGAGAVGNWDAESSPRCKQEAQFSRILKKKKIPNDLLHSLAKSVATRIAAEHLEVEDIMKAVSETGLRVEVRSMNMVIWELGQLQNWDAAVKAFRAFRAAGVEPNSYVCTTLIAINGYGRRLPQALQLFRWMEKKGIDQPLFAFNALIVACARCAAGDTAVELYEEMQELGMVPDRITFMALVSATTSAGQWERAQSFINIMQARGFSIGIDEYTEMLWACARARKPREAYGLFQEMVEQGCDLRITNYNALLCAYEKTGQWEDAMRTFVWIQDNGLIPDVMSWSTLISACANAGQAEIASEVLERMKASDCTPNVVSWCGLIKAHQRTGDWKNAEHTFQAMLDAGCAPNEVAWCSLLSAYEKGRQWKKVLYTVDKLEQLGHKLDVVAWSTTISALAKSGHWELAEEKFEKMQRKGCQPNVVTYTSLIRAYGDAGLWEKSESTFLLMSQKGIRCPSPPVKSVVMDLFTVVEGPNAQACCALLRAYAKGRELKKAIFLFERMDEQYGIHHDKFAYTAIFWACWTCGEWQQAAGYFDRMEKAGCTPDSVIYTTLIRMYEAHDQLDKAMQILERMSS